MEQRSSWCAWSMVKGLEGEGRSSTAQGTSSFDPNGKGY